MPSQDLLFPILPRAATGRPSDKHNTIVRPCSWGADEAPVRALAEHGRNNPPEGYP